ncbi:MAG: LysM peptidoglycan-binding domain-containing protein [Anaerolineae bacterium]|nr:MAG: LysM peptidoglycan-binding domain-containing protein [Anaerolineae bacterium]
MQSDWVAVTSQQQKVTLKATGICKVVTFKNRQKGAPRVSRPGVGCPGGVIYTVRRGDWLWAIARKYGTTAMAIKRANCLRTNTIWPGQRLCIPDP